MDTEFEVKFYPVNKDNLRSRLKKSGATLLLPERKMRRVIYDGMFHQEFSCDFVRVRDEGGKVTMSAKTHSQSGKITDQKETEVEVNDYDKTIQILTSMGLSPDRYQETLRETWELDGCKVDIDTWPGMDPYCEVESFSEAQVKKVSEKLGFAWEDHIISNPPDMAADLYQLDVKEILKKFANLTFENNPFANLPKKGIIKPKSKSA